MKVKNYSLFTVHCLLSVVYYILSTVFIPLILSAETLEDIINKVQENYENTTDLEANFTQESLIKTMDKIEKSEGKVYIKRPGKMRWDYKKPKRQEIVIDDGIIWMYQPEQNQVLKAPFSESPQNRTPVSFLYGVGRLKDDFEIKLSRGSKNYILGLTPKGMKGNIEKIFLEVDSKEFNIISFSLFDIYGNKTTITFKDIKVNKGLKDSIFHFKVPEGVRVIEQ